MLSADQLRQRRGLAVFGALLLVAIVIALIAGVGSGGDENAATAPALPPLSKTQSASDLGIAFSMPKAWDRINDNGVIRLRSPDGDAQVLLSSPAPAGQASSVLQAELKAIHQRYRVLSQAPSTAKKVGGLKGRQVVSSVQQSNGKPLQILALTANGDQHTYVVEVVAAANAPLGDAQLILNSLKLTG